MYFWIVWNSARESADKGLFPQPCDGGSKRGEKTYHFIEIMGCPGGCVTGGGQPQVDARTRYFVDPRAARAAATYSEDESKVIRKSHQNPAIKTIYAEFLGEPCGHKSHELLHTHYVDRSGK